MKLDDFLAFCLGSMIGLFLAWLSVLLSSLICGA